MARKKKHEEHQNHEAWAIPYGDLVTLLFALFTVMYAMSSVNIGKYRVLSDSLVAAFRGNPTSPNPIPLHSASSGNGGGDKQLSGTLPTALMKLRDPVPQNKVDLPAPPVSGPNSPTPAEGPRAGKDGTADAGAALVEMAGEIKAALQGLIDKKLVHVRQSALAVEVEINTDILFPSGVAQVSPQALPVLAKVAEILKPFPNAIRVEGHTDNRPIATAVFPSNWELSAARAANVVQLFAKSGVDPLRMTVLGLGEFRPVAPNDTAEGRNANRRVVVVIAERPPSDGQTDPVDAALAGTVKGPSVPGATVLLDKSSHGKPPP
jgi:chemotaxis protein MotB